MRKFIVVGNDVDNKELLLKKLRLYFVGKRYSLYSGYTYRFRIKDIYPNEGYYRPVHCVYMDGGEDYKPMALDRFAVDVTVSIINGMGDRYRSYTNAKKRNFRYVVDREIRELETSFSKHLEHILAKYFSVAFPSVFIKRRFVLPKYEN